MELNKSFLKTCIRQNKIDFNNFKCETLTKDKNSYTHIPF